MDKTLHILNENNKKGLVKLLSHDINDRLTQC